MSLSDELRPNINLMSDELKIKLAIKVNSKKDFGDYFLVNNLFLFPKDDIYNGLVINYAEGFFEQDYIRITKYNAPELNFKSVVTKNL